MLPVLSANGNGGGLYEGGLAVLYEFKEWIKREFVATYLARVGKDVMQ